MIRSGEVSAECLGSIAAGLWRPKIIVEHEVVDWDVGQRRPRCVGADGDVCSENVWYGEAWQLSVGRRQWLPWTRLQEGRRFRRPAPSVGRRLRYIIWLTAIWFGAGEIPPPLDRIRRPHFWAKTVAGLSAQGLNERPAAGRQRVYNSQARQHRKDGPEGHHCHQRS